MENFALCIFWIKILFFTRFALDVGFYGINLNTSLIIDTIGYSDSLTKGNIWEVLNKNAVGNIFIALMGTVPGYWITFFLLLLRYFKTFL